MTCVPALLCHLLLYLCAFEIFSNSCIHIYCWWSAPTEYCACHQLYNENCCLCPKLHTVVFRPVEIKVILAGAKQYFLLWYLKTSCGNWNKFQEFKKYYRWDAGRYIFLFQSSASLSSCHSFLITFAIYSCFTTGRQESFFSCHWGIGWMGHCALNNIVMI